MVLIITALNFIFYFLLSLSASCTSAIAQKLCFGCASHTHQHTHTQMHTRLIAIAEGKTILLRCNLHNMHRQKFADPRATTRLSFHCCCSAITGGQQRVLFHFVVVVVACNAFVCVCPTMCACEMYHGQWPYKNRFAIEQRRKQNTNFRICQIHAK